MGYDVSGTTYYGSWLFWGRPAGEIPDGWEAVPDAEWKGKIPVVMDDTDVDFDVVGEMGGSKTDINRANEFTECAIGCGYSFEQDKHDRFRRRQFFNQ